LRKKRKEIREKKVDLSRWNIFKKSNESKNGHGHL
jgi:hypothetical protein